MNRVDASNKPSVAELAGARMPADHGLSSLGLLMQLGGTIFLVLYTYLAIIPLMLGGGGAGNETLWWFLFAAASAVRSAFHRAAGRSIVYGSPSGPLAPTRIYIAVAAIHTVIAVVAMHKLFAPMTEFDSSFQPPTLSLIAACVAWPLALLVITTRRRFKQFNDTVLPTSEDLGFESVAVLMSLMGVVGMLVSAFMLISLVKAAGSPVANGFVFFTAMIMVMLVIRSFLHAKAGFVGVGGADPHTFHDRAQSYYNFGVVSAIIAGGGLLVVSFMTVFHPSQFLPIGMMVYLLLVWPLMLKKFFTERNFEVLMAGDNAPVLRRAPDFGLTGLGWLLIATSVTGLATAIASIIASPTGSSELLLFAVSLSGHVAPEGLERWLPLASLVLQLWAGIELVNMSDRHRLAANIFGGFGLIATIILHWDLFKSFGALGNALGGNAANPFGGGAVELFLPIVVALVIPIGVLLLANRQNIAAARVVPRQPR